MSDAPVHHLVRPFDPHGHRFEVVTTVREPTSDGQVLRLPAWIPGSYMIRDFSKNIVSISARDDEGPVVLHKVDKDTWRADPTRGALVVTLEVYAWDLSVRMAHLDATHGFFNGTSLFLCAEGHEDHAQAVTLEAPDLPGEPWRVATTLPRTSGASWGFGDFLATSYDALVDHPVEMGTFQLVSFEACGTPHHLALTGVAPCDLDRLAADLTRICAGHIRLFGEPAPFDAYVFLLTAVGDGYGGLEHRSSSANICKRADLPQPGVTEVTDGYRQLLGLLSHEYFHSWNVKRVKPRAFVPYALNRESHTTLLWAFEGITSYYDDLRLLRTGLIDLDSWLELVGQTATRVLRGSGRLVQSLSDSSFDAWTKFYKQDENAPNAIVSYYAKGALVAMALDLHLRRETDERVSLDDVMRTLWDRYGDGSGVPEDGVEAVASEVSGLDLTGFFDEAIRGVSDPPLDDLLGWIGVRWHARAASGDKDRGGRKASTKGLTRPGDLGVTVQRTATGSKLKHVHTGGAAHRAGLSAGDVVIALDGLKVGGSLTERVRALPAGRTVTLHAFRRDELHTVQATLDEPPKTTVWLESVDDDEDAVERRARWMADDRRATP